MGSDQVGDNLWKSSITNQLLLTACAPVVGTLHRGMPPIPPLRLCVQDNYPELMYKTLIINAPTTFRVLWAMVRHLMDARTQAKIEVRVIRGRW